jgi:hypothetical protein
MNKFLPQLDKEDAKGVRSFLPVILLGATRPAPSRQTTTPQRSQAPPSCHHVPEGQQGRAVMYGYARISTDGQSARPFADDRPADTTAWRSPRAFVRSRFEFGESVRARRDA